MTTKRDSKTQPKKDRPKLKKETVRDLMPREQAEKVRGGAMQTPSDRTQCWACW